MFLRVLFTILAICFGTSLSFAEQAKKPLLLMVHSYEKGHVCGQPQADGILSALDTFGFGPKTVDTHHFYMDTKRVHTSPQAIQQQGQNALAIIDKLKPDLVVTIDDNAFATVGLALATNGSTPVVFSGLNALPEYYNDTCHFMDSRLQPGSNVTGVCERLHLNRSLTVIRDTLPQVTGVVGITDPSPTGKAIASRFRLESDEGLPVAWEVQKVSNFSEYKKLILTLNKDVSVQAIYPAALTLQDGDNRVTAPEILRWTIEHSQKPGIPINPHFCELGLFGGASVDFRGMGIQAGAMVARILTGTPTGQISIVEAPDYTLVFNAARAKMLDIDIPENYLLAADEVYKDMKLLDSQR